MDIKLHSKVLDIKLRSKVLDNDRDAKAARKRNADTRNRSNESKISTTKLQIKGTKVNNNATDIEQGRLLLLLGDKTMEDTANRLVICGVAIGVLYPSYI